MIEEGCRPHKCSRTRSSHQRNKPGIEVESTRAAANDRLSKCLWLDPLCFGGH